MKISSKLFNEQQLNLLSKQMENIQSVQSKIASGKNIVFASDDPVGAVELSGLKDINSKVGQYINNAELSLSRLQMMDDTLEAAKNVFIRCNELAIQAANDVLAPSDRESIALEFDELKKELLSLANTTDSTGAHLFSGFKTKTTPFVMDSTGTVTYEGDRGVISLAVSESRMLESTIDGGTVFRDIVTSDGVSTDLFEAVDNISRSIRTASSGVEAAKYSRKLKSIPKSNDEDIKRIIKSATSILNREEGNNPYLIHEDLQKNMQYNVGIIRTKDEISDGISKIDDLKSQFKDVKAAGTSQFNPGWHEALALRNLLISSEAVAKSALLREESRGAHTREDFPSERKEWLEYNIINKKGKDGEMETVKVKRSKPDKELKRIANSSIEDLEKEVKLDHKK